MSSLIQQSQSANFGGSQAFPSGTTEGSTLICVAAGYLSGGSGYPVIDLPTTPGLVWELATTENGLSSGTAQTVSIFFCPNAPSIPSNTQTAVNASNYNGTTFNLNGFQVLEVGGLGAAAAITVLGAYGAAPAIAGAGNLPAPAGGSFLVAMTTDPELNSETLAGSGWTLTAMGGIGSYVGACQYLTTAEYPNSYDTSFSDGHGTYYGPWVVAAVAFAEVVVAPSLPVIPTATTGFTPKYPPTKKQPFTLWGLEAKRADSISVEGHKESVLQRIDEVTTLHFPYVLLSDMAAWKAFEAYALTGGVFTYLPILDYPNIPIGGALEDQMFQYPGTVEGETGCSLCQLLSMDWTPKFESFQIFSLDMKLRLVADQVGS